MKKGCRIIPVLILALVAGCASASATEKPVAENPVAQTSRQSHDAEATARAAAIVARLIKPEMTEFEKVLVLHDHVTDTVVYGKLDGETSAWTALCRGQADCVGFARGLDRLFKAAGLDSFVVVRKKGHLWVKVRIRGTYYNIDPTWSAIKSRWPQYNWFLLSDAQNVDAAKGVDHVLDSGESYPAAPIVFLPSPADYPHRQLLRSARKLRVSGVVSLPSGRFAPAGGIDGNVGGTRFRIPPGERSAFYIASFDRAAKTAPTLRVRVTGDPTGTYAAEAYHSSRGNVAGTIAATRFDLAQDDRTGVDITLATKADFAADGQRPARPVFAHTDLLAADATAARFRTGQIDPHVTALPASVEQRLFASPDERTVTAFVAALMAGTAEPFAKAKRIHDWMTLKIAYDSNLLVRMKSGSDPNGSVEPFGVLRYRRSNCEGLANLYAHLALVAGLEAKTVTGRLKRAETAAGKPMQHAWNHVRLGGTWYIVDCSADMRTFWTAGRLSTPMEYGQRCDHLFISPAAKRLAYLAAKADEQLLPGPLGENEFLALPRVEVAMAKYGINLDASLSARRSVAREKTASGGSDLFDQYHSSGGIFEMRLGVPENTFVQPFLADAAGKNLPGRAVVTRDAAGLVCRFFMPQAGTHVASLNARDLADPQNAKNVYTFRIVADRGVARTGAEIEWHLHAVLLGAVPGRMYRHENTGSIIVEIIHPVDVKTVAVVRDSAGKNVACTVRKEAFPQGTRHEIVLPPATDRWIHLSGSADPDTSGKGNQPFFTIAAAAI